MIRPLLTCLLLALLPGLAGCRGKSVHRIEVAVVGDDGIALGDPAAPPRDEAQAVLRLAIAQGLVRLDSGGQVEPGLAERWNVSDDGLSYIFRLESGEWPDGRRIMARDVARILNRLLRSNRDHPTREALGAVEEVVAMTDRVLEVKLRAPRPTLLQLLAQPEFTLIREGVGSGPFHLRDVEGNVLPAKPGVAVQLRRRLPGLDGEPGEREDIALRALPASAGIAAFVGGRIDLLLGGTIADLPLARSAKADRGALRFDPASGLFGLAPARRGGPLDRPELRRVLSAAVDRDALVAELAVPGLAPRATLLQSGLDDMPDPAPPEWAARPLAERRPALAAEVRRLFDDEDRPKIRIALPGGPGGDRLFARLFADWGAIGIAVERAEAKRGADLALVDQVAPSTSPAWYLRQFRCAVAPVCLPAADEILAAAREAPVAAQRAALFVEASKKMDEEQLFIALAAPVRWSLVGERATGFQENRFARHPLTGIMRRNARKGFGQ